MPGLAAGLLRQATGQRFFAGFFLAGDGELAAVAGCSLCSGIFATVRICICWLTGAVGCAASSNCSSPSPTDCRRFDEILKVLTRMSRIASALLWLSSALFSRFPLASMWPTIRKRVWQHARLDQRVGDAPDRLVGIRQHDRRVGVELDVDIEARQLGKLGRDRRPLLRRRLVLRSGLRPLEHLLTQRRDVEIGAASQGRSAC